MLSVQVSYVAVDVYCDSHNNPAGRSKGCVVGFVIICKTNARKSHVEQIHCRSDVEYPGSVLLKALHLVHAHHCHKTCKEVKRPGTRVKESVRRNLLSPMQVRDHLPRMNMRSTIQKRAYIVLEDVGKYLDQIPFCWSSLKSSFCSSDQVRYKSCNQMASS